MSYNFTESTDSANVCQVCGDQACNWYYGAVVCEACKKFFIRSKKEEKRKYACIANKQCSITKSTRANCQYCRYVKCLEVGLDLNKKASQVEINSLVQTLKCAVCEQKPSGIHFGVMSCEACKGFFRRSCLNSSNSIYKCKYDGNGNCFINSNRSCRYCRFKKCLEVGMSFDNCKLGRTTNKVKQEIIKTKKTKRDDREENDFDYDSTKIYNKSNQFKRARYETLSENTSLSSIGSFESPRSIVNNYDTQVQNNHSNTNYNPLLSQNQSLTNISSYLMNQHYYNFASNEDYFGFSNSSYFNNHLNQFDSSNVNFFNATKENQTFYPNDYQFSFYY